MTNTENHANGVATTAETLRVDQFWGWLHKRGRRSRTISAYQTDWREFTSWYQQTNDEPFDLTRLTALDLNDYRNWGLSQQLAPSTLNRRLGFFKHYAAWGLEERFVEASVFRAIKAVGLVRQQKLAPKALSQAEVRRLLKEVELRADVRDQAILYTLLYIGLRVGELAHLQIEDVHFQTEKGPSWCGAIMPRVAPHVLRHTFSYNYLEKTGNDLIGLATILGHDNVTTTQIYTQKPLGALQDEIEKVQFF